jgi:hypothetical protein
MTRPSLVRRALIAFVALVVVVAILVLPAASSPVPAGDLVTATSEQAAASSADPKALRVLVVVLDGLEAREVGPLTPTVNQLKSEGTWYEEARAVFPSETLPNHAAMMTGVLPEENGIVGNDFWQGRPGEPSSTWSRVQMEDPALLGADTLTTRLENACEISTATVLSKTYLVRLFTGENTAIFRNPYGLRNADNPTVQRQADFHWTPPWTIPFSDHHPDPGTMDAFRQWLRTSPATPQFAFVNLGDIDRSGHADPSGVTGVSAFRQAVLEDSDAQLGMLVNDLKASGAWDETVMIVTSDHGMDWSVPDNLINLNSINVTVEAGNSGRSGYMVVPGGGTAAVYIKNPDDIVPIAKAIAAHRGVSFVATAQSIPELGNPTLKDLGMQHPYGGDVVVFAKAGWAVRDSQNFNPIPGNHGHSETQPSVLLVAGGHPVLDDPESVPGEQVYDPGTLLEPPKKLFSPPAGGPGNLSVAPTVAALFGIDEPAGGYERGPLVEAFEPYALKSHTPCEAAVPAEVVTHALLAGENLEIGGGGVNIAGVDRASDIHSNADVKISGSGGEVCGDISAVGEIENLGRQCDGFTSTEGAPAVPLPDMAAHVPTTDAATETLNGDQKLDGYSCASPDGCVVWVKNGKLEIQGDVTGDVWFLADKEAIITGSLSPSDNESSVGIYSPLKIEASSQNANIDATLLSAKDIKLSGSAQSFTGLLWANKLVELGGSGSNVTGAMISGGLLKISGSAVSVTYDPDATGMN